MDNIISNYGVWHSRENKSKTVRAKFFEISIFALPAACKSLNRATRPNQGCQMVSFQTQTANLGKFWRALDWKMLIYIFWPFGIFYGHLGYFMTIWCICVHLVHFFLFWYHVPRKIWQPCPKP
jgi:hypothetical protein